VLILKFPAAKEGDAPISQSVYFPNIGQYLDIESLKLSLSANNYNQLLSAGTVGAIWALDIVDAVAHLQVLCPGLGRDLSFNSYLDIPIQKANQIVSVYKDQFLPWYWPQLRPLLEEAKILTPQPKAPAKDPQTDLSDLDQYNDKQPEAAAPIAQL